MPADNAHPVLPPPRVRSRCFLHPVGDAAWMGSASALDPTALVLPDRVCMKAVVPPAEPSTPPPQRDGFERRKKKTPLAWDRRGPQSQPSLIIKNKFLKNAFALFNPFVVLTLLHLFSPRAGPCACNPTHFRPLVGCTCPALLRWNSWGEQLNH